MTIEVDTYGKKIQREFSEKEIRDILSLHVKCIELGHFHWVHLTSGGAVIDEETFEKLVHWERTE